MKDYINYTYMIFVTPRGKGYGCFAIKSLEKNSFRVAASFCHPADASRFNKKKARLIANNRLNDKDCYVDISADTDDPKELLKVIFNLTNLNIPNWAYNAYYVGAYYSGLHTNNMSYMAMVYDLDLFAEYYPKIYNNKYCSCYLKGTI